MKLPCQNCQKLLEADEAKLFLAVYVCSGCHEFATRAQEKIERELAMLSTVSKEALRQALIEGRLHPSEEAGQGTHSLADLLVQRAVHA